MGHLRIRNWDKYQRIAGDKAPYVQVQTDILLDMEFMGLPDRERLCFLLLLCLAGRTQNKLPADPHAIMHLCHFDDVPDVSLMMSRGLLEEWCEDKHRQTIETDEERRKYERRRKRQWRESRKCPENVPAKSQGETETETETDIETETKERAETRTPRKRGTRLPADWQPNDELLAWAAKERPDLDMPRTVENFTDYWLAKTGASATKLDWDATFRYWVRNERTNGTGKGAIRETAAERSERIENEIIAAAEAKLRSAAR